MDLFKNIQNIELKKNVKTHNLTWLSHFWVTKRVAKEFDYHKLYSNFLDVLDSDTLKSLIVSETLTNIKVSKMCTSS